MYYAIAYPSENPSALELAQSHSSNCKPSCFALAVALLLCLCSGAVYAQGPVISCDSDPLLFNTGYDGSGGVVPNPGNTPTLTTNNSDLNWEVGFGSATTNVSSVASYSPAFVVGEVIPQWEDEHATATWVSIVENGLHPPANTDIDSYYRYQFALAADVNLAAFSLDMDFFSDNTVWEIYVNGVAQSGKGVGNLPNWAAGSPGVTGYVNAGFRDGNEASVSLPHDWQLGPNELVVHVKSRSSREGFLAEVRPATLCPVLAPRIALEKSASGPLPTYPDDTINYSFVVHNNGNVPLTGVTVIDALVGLSAISCPKNDLAIDERMTCSATYVATEADAIAGSVDNTAAVTGQPPAGSGLTEVSSSSDMVNWPVVPTPVAALSLLKTASGASPTNHGDTINYSFVVTNTGSVPLTAVTISDPLPGLSAIDCPSADLAPATMMTCTATYRVTEADALAGTVNNRAEVTGQPPAGSGLTVPTTESSSAWPVAELVPGITLLKSATGPDTVRAGDRIDYRFVITNTGTAPLTSVTLTDPLPGISPMDCPATDLAPAVSMDCTAFYIANDADAALGYVNNTATVSAIAPGGLGAPGASSSARWPIDPTLVPAIALEKTVTGSRPVTEGETLNYSFEVTNTGTAPLLNVAINDPMPGLSAIDCPSTSLGVGEAVTCSATYTVSADDAATGFVRNTATVTGQPPFGFPAPSDSSSVRFPAEETSVEEATLPRSVPVLPAPVLLLLMALLGYSAIRQLPARK